MSTTENQHASTFNFGRNDFLIIRKMIDPGIQDVEGLRKTEFQTYSLYTKMHVSISKSGDFKILIIGEIFSAHDPFFSNQEIADSLAQKNSFENILSELRECSGRYIVFKITEKTLQFVGDAMGQFEVYYKDDFSGVASNMSVLSCFVALSKWKGDAEKLYSKIAATTRIQIGTTTSYANAKHLMPNHFANSNSKEQIRHFPTQADIQKRQTTDEVVDQIEGRMKNFAKAMNHRSPLALPLTGGRDSRYLLGIFKRFDLKLFVFKHPTTSEDHFDIKTGKELAAFVEKEYEIIRYKPDLEMDSVTRLNSFSERPRDNPIPYLMNAYPQLEEYLIINGHGGEIGRSFFGKVYNLNHKKMATILGYPKNKFVNAEMKKWLDEIQESGDTGENLIDYFYWEQRMGNWGARIKTETANVAEMVAPMNSLAIISAFLTVPKNERQFYSNDLFEALIRSIDPNLLNFPLNSSRKNRAILLLIRLNLYWIYRNLRLNILTYL